MTTTLFLKLLGPVLLFLIALAQAGLDYKWRDRRTKWHRRAKVVFLALLVVAVVCSVVLAVLDQRSNDDLKNHLMSVERKLDPFLELAKARFPGLDSEGALKRLSAEIKEHESKITNLERTTTKAETERQMLARQLDSERSTIRDFGADFTLDFSGDWTQEPWVWMISSVADEFYIFLWSRIAQSNLPLLKLFATESYSFTTTGKGQARFQARQAVRRGEAPLGALIDILSNYDAIGFWIPFVDYKQMATQEITISRIEIVFTFNGKHGKPLILDGPFKAPVKLFGDNKAVAWASVARPLDPAVWKGMWPN